MRRNPDLVGIASYEEVNPLVPTPPKADKLVGIKKYYGK